MWVDLEPIASQLRVFADGDAIGNPYAWCATVRHIDMHTVEILGVMRAPRPSEWRAIIAAFAQTDVQEIIFRRYRDGEVVTKRIKVA